jgi:hypothetical protein
MALYRIYAVSDDDHYSGIVRVIECATDDAALARAKQLVDGHSVEVGVWKGGRLIARVWGSPAARSGAANEGQCPA